MKPILLAVTICTFAISSTYAGTRENKRLEEGKITKNEAQHLVLNKYPGAKIESCELTKGRDHSNWTVTLFKPGSHETTQVQVDGLTGKLLTP